MCGQTCFGFSRFCRYEWIEIALLHQSVFASKWMQALYAALGHSFPADNVFALLFVLYNPVCRKDISRKKRLFSKLLAEAVYPVHKEYLGREKTLWFYIKSRWAMLKFAVKNRALADCNPTLVLAASQQPHAAVLKDINRILLHVNSQERDAKTNWNTAKTMILSKMKVAKRFLKNPNRVPSAVESQECGNHQNISQSASISWFEKIQNCWKRANRVAPIDSNNEQRYDDAPKLFVDSFALKREFVESYISETATLSLLTMMIFNDADDFGSSRDCRRYRHKFDANLVSFQKTFRTLFCLSKNLEFADSSEQILRLTRKERMLQRAFDMIFGEELKLLRNFNWLSDKEIAELFLMHDFPELEVDDFSGTSVDAVLKQLLAADEAKLVEPSRNGIQAPTLDDNSHPNTLNIVYSIDESSQVLRAIPELNVGAPCVDEASQQLRTNCEEKRFQASENSIQENADYYPNTLMNLASVLKESSKESLVNSAHTLEVDTQLGPAVSVMPRLRPGMYSSQNLVVAASANINHGASPASRSDEVQFSGIAAVGTDLRSAQVESIAEIHRATAAEAEQRELLNRVAALSDELRFANAGTAAALKRAAASDAQVKDSAADVARMAAQVKDLQAALQVASQAHKSATSQSKKIVSTSAELRDAQIKLEVQTLTVQVKDLHTALKAVSQAAGVSMDYKSSQVSVVSSELISAFTKLKRSASELKDLQAALLAALQRAAAAETEVHTLRHELRVANAGTAAAIEPAAASDAHVRDSAADVARLPVQVKELHAALQAANQAVVPSYSAVEVHAEAVNPSVENVKKLVDDSIQQQVRRALLLQSATGGAAIATFTQPKTSHVMKTPSPSLSHLGNDAFFRHNFAAPSKNRSSEAMPPNTPFTKARQP